MSRREHTSNLVFCRWGRRKLGTQRRSSASLVVVKLVVKLAVKLVVKLVVTLAVKLVRR